MIEYARDAIEDIHVLSEAELKVEVQRVNDRLIARGLKKS